ncbi:MobV family relaxase [Desulfonatronum parangueonense]
MKKTYAILRIKKLKRGEVVKSARHAFREIETPNADPDLRQDNAVYGERTAKKVDEAVKKRIDELNRKSKIRKDAVYCIEFLVTYSPGALEPKEAQQYFMDALRWIGNKFGKENVVSAVIHHDEKTPHLCVFLTPIFNSRLNARDRFGGPAKMSKMQDDFAAQVGGKHGLIRGKKKSKAKHAKVKQFYGLLNKELADIPKPQIGMVITRFKAQQHIDEAHEMAQAAIAKNLALRLESERMQQQLARINELEREKEVLAAKLEKIQEVFAKANVNQENLCVWLNYAQEIVAKHEKDIDRNWSELLRRNEDMMYDNEDPKLHRHSPHLQH